MSGNSFDFSMKYASGLAYRESGNTHDPNALTLVFLHGGSFSSAVFESHILHEKYEGTRTLAFDLPGHGASINFGTARPYTFENFGTAIFEALDILEARNIVLVGWSLGGHVALDMLDRDRRIKGAVICGAPPLHRGVLASIWAYHFTLDMLLASKRVFTSVDAARFERMCIGENANGAHVKAMMNVDPAMRGSVANSVFQGLNRDQHLLASSTKKPLMFVQGENDPLVRTSYMDAFAASVDYRGSYHLIENAGHAAFIDQPDVFAATIARFANGIDMASDTQRAGLAA